jgi:hypothetical protein
LSARRRYNRAATSADGTASGPSRFFAELKRRNVVRVALVYLDTAWLIVNVGTIVGETFEAPHWVMRTVILAAGKDSPTPASQKTT